MDIVVGPQTGSGFRIEQIWAAVIIHEDGDESIPGVLLPNSVTVPLIAADPKRLAWVRKEAQRIARSTSKRIRIACFRIREDQELIEP